MRHEMHNRAREQMCKVLMLSTARLFEDTCDLSTVWNLADVRIEAPDERTEFVDIDGKVIVITVGAELQAINQFQLL